MLKSVLSFLQPDFLLPILLLAVDLFEVQTAKALFKAFYVGLDLFQQALSLFDLFFGFLNLLEMPLDDLQPIIVYFRRVKGELRHV